MCLALRLLHLRWSRPVSTQFLTESRVLISADTGPLFDPSQAPVFGSNGLVYPSETNFPAIQPTAEFSMATTISGIILPTTPLSPSSTLASRASSRSSSHSVSSTASVSSSASSSASRLASSTSSSAATSTSASAPAQQSTGAAVANRGGVVGAVAGGLLAGLVLA